MDCQEASRAQSEALEHPLPCSKRIGLKIHVFICRWCQRYGRQLRFLHDAAHDHAESLTDASPQKLSPAARDRIKQKLQSEK
jgi:hypothetical protein